MRMRKKKHLNDRMALVSSFLIGEPSDMAGKWAQISGGRPLHLEIGCGKGKFICETAALNPDIFYIALEKIPDVLVMAMEKADKAALENVRFIRGDAGLLRSYFACREAERIYLNFSDPWPSNRHRERRLTAEGYLRIYADILSESGSIFFKTDNSGLFEFSVREFTRCGWILKNVTRDLHGLAGGGFNPAGGAVTEYEQRFSSMGVPINRLEAYKR